MNATWQKGYTIGPFKMYSNNIKMKCVICFFLALLVLIVSEYFFLQEIFGSNQTSILLVSLSGVISSVVLMVYIIRQYK